MRKKGFDTDDTGYFLYCDGNRFTENTFLKKDNAFMEFKITLIPYKSDLSWIDPTLAKIYRNLRLDKRPAHNPNCEYGQFIVQSKENGKTQRFKTLF